jgi:hypothetical protein
MFNQFSSNQLRVLDHYHVVYCKAYLANSMPMFWILFYQVWFHRFPERTRLFGDDAGVLDTWQAVQLEQAIKLRKLVCLVPLNPYVCYFRHSLMRQPGTKDLATMALLGVCVGKPVVYICDCIDFLNAPKKNYYE